METQNYKQQLNELKEYLKSWVEADTRPCKYKGFEEYVPITIQVNRKAISVMMPKVLVNSLNTKELKEIVQFAYKEIHKFNDENISEMITKHNKFIEKFDKHFIVEWISPLISMKITKEYRKKTHNKSKNNFNKNIFEKLIINVSKRVRIVFEENYMDLKMNKKMFQWVDKHYHLIKKYETHEKNIVYSFEQTEDRYKSLIYLYLEDLSETILNIFQLNEMSIEELEILLGVRNLKRRESISNNLEYLLNQSLKYAYCEDINDYEYTDKKYKDNLYAFFQVPNYLFYENIRKAIYRKNFKFENEKIYANISSNQKDLQARLYIVPEKDKTHYLNNEELEVLKSKLKDKIKKIDDLTIDVMDALFAILFNEGIKASQWVFIDVDSILSLRGLKQNVSKSGRRGGYKDKQRQDVAEIVKIILSLYIAIDNYGSLEFKGKKKIENYCGYLFNYERVGYINPYLWKIKLGDVFRDLIYYNRQIAYMSYRILNYDCRKNILEKRLARYFSYLWRVRQSKMKYLDTTKISTILDNIYWNQYKNSSTQRESRLVKAFDRLKEDRLIADWTPILESNNVMSGIIVEPPHRIIKLYSSMRRRKKIKNKDEEIVLKIIKKRKESKLTYIRSAEDIGIPPNTLLRMENGYDIDLEEKEKILNWITGM